MKIIPLAADSMGSRSMAVFVETRDAKIIVDPGAAVVPLRFGLSPHPLEKWQLQKHADRIRLFTESARTVVITSYHSDHFTADRPEWLKNKVLIVKNPNQRTTPVERKAAFNFLKTAKTVASEILFADGRTFTVGSAEIGFSPSCSSGQEFFIGMFIRSDERSFLFSSNAQGPASDEAANWLENQQAEFLYLDGPVTYLQKRTESLTTTLDRMMRVVLRIGAKDILLDHHPLRDLNWKKHLEPFFRFGSENGLRIRTAAEYRGEESAPLEARRNLLYQDPRSQ
ncbi:MAG TPA: hypothetical protein VGB38_02300 [bacterium]